MLRTDVLIWIVIVWIICTCMIAVHIHNSIETSAATKKFEQYDEPNTITYVKDPLTQDDVIDFNEQGVEDLLLGVKNTKIYYEVPLSEDLQDHIFEECAKYAIHPAIVIAMIGKESGYNPDAVGDGGNSLGLMQIQPKWHRERFKKLNITNLFNPKQNVTVGIDILAELYETGKPIEWILMAYNGGRSYANEKAALGIVSDYANMVIAKAAILETYEVVKG